MPSLCRRFIPARGSRPLLHLACAALAMCSAGDLVRLQGRCQSLAADAGWLRPGAAATCFAHAAVCLRGGAEHRTLRVRGGEADAGVGDVDDGSAIVSDRGLLESMPPDGNDDLSAVHDYRDAMMARLSKMDEADVSMLLGNKAVGLGANDNLASLQQFSRVTRPSPIQVHEIDYAAAAGVNISALRAEQKGQVVGDTDGVRLRECDEALFREEDEMYAAARRLDETGSRNGETECRTETRITQKQKRLARIKALLRCKAAAMTRDAMHEQTQDGVSMPLLEMGTAEQREWLNRMREAYRPLDPSPGESSFWTGSPQHPLQHVDASTSSAANSSGRLDATKAEPKLDATPAHAAQSQDPAATCAPYEPMQHPYLVFRMPNASAILYEHEEGDLEEGLRVEGVRRGVEGEDPWVDAGGGSLAGKGSLSRDAADSGLRSGHTWKVMNMSLQNELMEAAELGDSDGLVKAIQMGANLDTGEQTPYTVSALHLAARGNRLGVMQQLLLHGQDANAQDHCLATPLHYASDRGCLEAAQVLLAAGANVSAVDCYGRSPLHRAAVEAPRR